MNVYGGHFSEFPPIKIKNPPKPPKKDPPPEPEEKPPVDPPPEDPKPPDDPPPDPDAPFPDSPPEEDPPPDDPPPDDPDDPDDDDDDDDDDGDPDDGDPGGDPDPDGRIQDALDRMEEAAARAEEARARAEEARGNAELARQEQANGQAAVNAALDAANDAQDAQDKAANLPVGQLAGPPAKGLWRTGVGEPVDPLTGAWLYEHTDAIIDTAAPALSVRRYYCSRLFRRGSFGLGWDTWMDTSVRLLATGAAYLATGDGSGGFFGPPPAAGQPFAAPDELDGTRLTKVGAAWRIVAPDGWVRDLDAGGRLTRVVSPDGVGITVRRSAAGLMTALEHDDGPRLAITTAATGLVSEVRDDLGRRWIYAYDAAARLQSVRGPLNRTWRYAYSSSSDPRERGAITELRDPAGSVAVTNSYGGPGPLRGRVLEQHAYGDPWTFTYTLVTPMPEPVVANRNTVALRVVVRDPTGKATTHEFGATGRLLSTSLPVAGGPAITRWSWSTDGQPTEITRPRGDRVLLTWARQGPSWQCTRIAQRFGSTTIASEFVFDAAGHLVALIDALGARTDFERDAAGRLLRVLQPQAPVVGGTPQRAATTYTYDARGRVLRRQDADGSILEQTYLGAGPGAGMVATLKHDGTQVGSFDYDQAGRLIRAHGPDATVAAQEWNEADELVAEVDPTGARREYSYDNRGAVTKIRQQMLDENGAAQTRPWVVTDVQCDVKGRIVRTTTATPAGTAASSQSFDGLDRIIETQGPLGLRTTYAYDARGLVVEKREGAGTASEAVYRWEHELGGEAVTFIDPTGKRWLSTVDGFGRPASVARPDGVSDAVSVDRFGRAVDVRTSDGTGQLVAHERAAFDPSGKLASTGARVLRDGLAPGPWANTELGYDVARRLVRMLNPVGAATTFAWSSAGLVEVADAVGNALRYDHDAYGFVSAVESVAVGPGGPAQVRTSYTHDALGRLLAEQDALGNRSTHAYDGLLRPVLSTGPTATSARVDYDDLGAVARIRVSGGPGAAAVTTFENDLEANLVAVTDPDGARHTILRDLFGRVVSLAGPDPAMKWTTAYDAAGRISTATTPAGWTATFDYDAVGRTLRSRAVRGADVAIETWEYDALGHVTRAKAPAHDVRSQWDSLGRCWSESLDGAAVALTWAPVGPLRSLQLPDATKVDYMRDVVGRLTRVTTTRPGSAALRSDIEWWDSARLGRVRSRVGTKVTTSEYSYDRAGRPLRLSVSGQAGVIERITILPDGQGVPALVHRSGHEVRAYEVDRFSQLTAVWAGPAGPIPGISQWLAGGTGTQASIDQRVASLRPSGNARWRADLTAGGDRTRVSDAGAISIWQPDGAHRYQQVGGQIPVYDSGGRLSAWRNYRFKYDHRDRLVRVENPAGALIAERTFDACGRPVTWKTPAGTRRAVMVGLDVLGEDAAGAARRYAPGVGIDQPVAVHDGSGWQLLHRDQSWSVLATSNPAGVVQARAAWGPGGEANPLTAAFGPAAALGAHLRFQGRPDLADGAGLVDLRHRVLLSEWGRFTAPDPVGPDGGLNPYVFAGNNPLIFVDPTGEIFFLVPILAGALIGGAIAAVTNWDKSGADFAVAVAAGAAGGAIMAIPGLGVAAFALGGAATGLINGGYQGYKQDGIKGALVNGGINAVIGSAAGLAGGVVGARVATGATAMLTTTLTQGSATGLGTMLGTTGSRIASQYIGSGLGGAAGGFTGGFTGGTMQSVFSPEFANAEGVAALQVALTYGLHQGTDGAKWGAVGAVGTKALMQGGWLITKNPEGGGGLNKVLGAEGEFQAQKQVGGSKGTYTTPGGKRPDIWGAQRFWSGKRIYGDAKNTNKVPSLNKQNAQLQQMLDAVPNPFDPANPAAGGNKFTIFHAPGIKLPGSNSAIGKLVGNGVIELVPLEQYVFGNASTNDHIC